MSSYNHFHINDRNEDFVDVMKKVSQQGESSDAQEKKVEVYVTLGEHNRLVTITGERGKFDKKISLEQLIKIFDEIITDPASNQFSELELESVIKGMETLKFRFKNKRLSATERFRKIILRAFGYQEKYDYAVEKIGQLSKGLKIELLNFKVAKLIEEKERILEINRENLFERFKRNSPIATPTSDKANREALYTIEKSIEVLREKIQLLEQGEGNLKISKKPVAFSFFTPPVDVLEKRVLRIISNRLGPSPEGETGKYVQYLRTLIFGFATGQKKSIQSLDQQMGFNVNDLKKMLLGGNSINNMFYVANYLDNFLAKQKLEATEDPKYMDALEKLQSDLKRSLPIALSNYTLTLRLQQGDYVGEEEFQQLFSHIKGSLQEVQVGGKLIIPIQTIEHATLLVFEKMKDGRIQSIFYNTGEGVSRHVTMNLSVKALSDNLNSFVDRYPVSKIYEPFAVNGKMESFEKGMIDLFNIKHNKGMGEVYTSLENALGAGESGKAKRVQINGVCSFQSLSEVFKDTLGSKENYLRFKRGFLQNIQQDFKEITKAMEPLLEENEEMVAVYTLHQNLLADNQAEIDRSDRLLKRLEGGQRLPRSIQIHPLSGL